MTGCDRLATRSQTGVAASNSAGRSDGGPLGWPGLFFGIWLFFAVVGRLSLQWYAGLPGRGAHGRQEWHRLPEVQPCPGRFTLIMFVHPHCPCSRASVEELSIIMTRCAGQLQSYVYFYKPRSFSGNWEKTDLWFTAASIPGVTVVKDEDGAIAAEFGSCTSGQSLLYDASRRLIFSGGITASRGHIGDNPGLDAVVDAIRCGSSEYKRTSVFGCPLVGRDCKAGMTFR